jgi:carbamoyl-phosphate synthase large subunit
MRPNILITSVSQDGQKLRAFQRALDSLLPNGRVLAADAQPNHLTYAYHLLEMCISNDVGLVVSTDDQELPKLARHRREFANAGVAIAVSDPRFVDMTRDKRTMMDWFRGRGMQTPRTIHSRRDATFPIVAIPNNARGGQQPIIVNDAAQFASLLLDDPELMFTECLSPLEFEECTIDMCYSEDGMLKLAWPRQEAVVASRTAASPIVALVRQRFEKVPGARGCITMRLCVHGRTEAAYGIDLKAHLDEKQPYEAAANFARCLIEEYLLSHAAASSHRQAA